MTGIASNDPARSADGVTFGQAIAKARNALGFSQKERAARVMKDEGGGSISPDDLNNNDHDRRNLGSGHPIRQCCGILNIPEDDLNALAGRLPDDVRPDASTPDKIVEEHLINGFGGAELAG